MRLEETNLEALRAKRAVVDRGYMADPFIAHLAPPTPSRDFIMNRGYWSRSVVFRGLIDAFRAGGGRQVLALGCGLDTLAFKALQDDSASDGLRFFECDLPEVSAHKVELIRASPALTAQLQTLAGAVEFSAEGIRSDRYTLFPMDLNRPGDFVRILDAVGLKREEPTLVVAECVLVYLHPESISAIKATLCAYFPQLCLVDYEMCGTASPFSRVMLRNFAQRGIPLLAIGQFADFAQIRASYAAAGFVAVEIEDMCAIYQSRLNPVEVRRVAAIDRADEFEEFNLMQAHYFVSVAANCREGVCARVGLAALAEYVEPAQP